MLIRISPHIEHSITTITGSVPNVRFSGSFVASGLTKRSWAVDTRG